MNNLPDLEYPAHEVQLEAMGNRGAYDRFKTFLETQSKEADAMRAYESLQKREGVQKTLKTIEDLSPGYKPTGNATQSGDRAVKAFTEQYQAEKKELAPIFKRVDELAEKIPSSPDELLQHIESAIPEIRSYLTTTEEGGIKLAKYSPSMPFSRNVYSGIRDSLQAVQSEKTSIAGIRNIRESLRGRVNMLSDPRDGAQMGSLRKSLMDYIEGQIQKVAPDTEVRDAFRRYAVNEEQRSLLEKVFGGSLSDRAGVLKAVKSEEVVDRIFANTATVKAARQVLGPEKFNRILADHLAEQAAKFTDKGSFSSAKFATFLKGKADVLNEAFSGSPDKLARLRSLADYMRILPDSPSINPSGTAKTLSIMGQIANIGHI
jgi:hypothetical protein